MSVALRAIRIQQTPPQRDQQAVNTARASDDRCAGLLLCAACSRAPAHVRERSRSSCSRSRSARTRTVFSVLNGLFLRPLPYPDGDRLVMVYDSYTKISNLGNAGTAIPDYLERRDQAKSLESLAITAGMARTLGGEGEPLRLVTMRASASLFTVLRSRASDRPRVHGRRGDTGQRPRRRPQR